MPPILEKVFQRRPLVRRVTHQVEVSVEGGRRPSPARRRRLQGVRRVLRVLQPPRGPLVVPFHLVLLEEQGQLFERRSEMEVQLFQQAFIEGKEKKDSFKNFRQYLASYKNRQKPKISKIV